MYTNKISIDKIGESAGNPTWNGGAWPGSSGLTLMKAWFYEV
jgi:hypothetical protein